MARKPKAEFEISAKDRSKAALSRVEKNLKRFSGLVTKIGGLVGGVSFALITKQSIENTIRQEQALKQLDARLKSTRGAAGLTKDALVEMSSGLQQVTNFGDEAVQEMQSLLLTFTKIHGPQFVAAQEAILNIATAMDMDLRSAALQVGKALNDPVANMGALSRAGIQFSKDQKAVIKSLFESGRVAEAQQLVLEELETQFGGAARAARQTFGGALTSLGNAFGDLLEADSMDGARMALEDLTKMLQDPRTVRAAAALTRALIEGFRKSAEFLRDTIHSAEQLGLIEAPVNRNAKAIQFLNTQIQDLQGSLTSAKIAADKVSDPESIIGRATLEHLAQVEAQMDRLKAKRTALMTGERAQPLLGQAPVQPNIMDVPAGAEDENKTTIPGGGLTDKKAEAELERIQRFVMSRRDIEIADHQQRVQFVEQNMQNEAARDALVEKLKKQHQDRLSEIEKEGLTEREKFMQMSTGAKIKTLLGETAALTEGVAQQNKTLFKINKAATLANIALSAPGAIAEAVKNAGGLPWGAWAGIMTAAKYVGLAQAASGTNFGSGNSAPSLAGQGGGGSTVNTVPVRPPPAPEPQQTSQQSGRAVNIVISGPVDREYLKRALIPALQEEINDNDVTFINADSAQARELRRAS